MTAWHQFPHIPRLFTATSLRSPLLRTTGRIALWVGIVSLVTVNGVLMLSHAPDPWKRIVPVLLHPLSQAHHYSLAQAFWSAQLPQLAHIELNAALAISKFAPDNVLGDTTESDIIAQWEQDPTELTHMISYWETVASQKPDFRDAFVILALAYSKLGNANEAAENARTALQLDPSYEKRPLLLSLLGEN